MSDNDVQKVYFLRTFPGKVIRVLEYLRTCIESEMHLGWRDQYFLCVVGASGSQVRLSRSSDISVLNGSCSTNPLLIVKRIFTFWIAGLEQVS